MKKEPELNDQNEDDEDENDDDQGDEDDEAEDGAFDSQDPDYLDDDENVEIPSRQPFTSSCMTNTLGSGICSRLRRSPWPVLHFRLSSLTILILRIVFKPFDISTASLGFIIC